MDFVGKEIKKRRTMLRMTQEELALKSGYKTKGSIQKIEDGTTDVTNKRLSMIAKALGCTPSDLLSSYDKAIDNSFNNLSNNSNNVTHTTSHNHYYDDDSKKDSTAHIIVTENTKKYFLGIIDNVRNMDDDQLLDVLKYCEFVKSKKR